MKATRSTRHLYHRAPRHRERSEAIHAFFRPERPKIWCSLDKYEFRMDKIVKNSDVMSIGVADFAIGDVLTSFPALYELARCRSVELWFQHPAIRRLWAGPDVRLLETPSRTTIHYDIRVGQQRFLQSGLHMIDAWYWILGLPVPNRPSRIDLKTIPGRGFDVLISPFSASGRLAKEPHKIWNFKKWNDLIDRLLGDGLSVAICGVFTAGRDPRSHDERFWGARDVMVLDALPLDELGGHIRASRCTLTVDNGIGHFAHLLGTHHLHLVPSHPKAAPVSWIRNRNEGSVVINRSFEDLPGALTVNEVREGIDRVLYAERKSTKKMEFPEHKYEYSAITCVRGLANFIVEWLNYYRTIGFDHIYLYCNDADPRELYEKTLPFTLGPEPFVTFRHYPVQDAPSQVHRHFFEHDCDRSEWIGFFDVGEYLRLPPGMTIGQFVAQMGTVDCVLFNRVLFGPGGDGMESGSSILSERLRRQEHLPPLTKCVAKSKIFADCCQNGVVRMGEFWHCPLENAGVPVRALNVIGEDMSGYYDGFPERSFQFINEPARKKALLATAMLHHYVFSPETEFSTWMQHGSESAFSGRTSLDESAASDRFKFFFDGLYEVEDQSLADFWPHFLNRAYAACVSGAWRSDSLSIGRGKTATQSSVSAWSRGMTPEIDAINALNGIIDGSGKFHTDIEDSPWWMVDLEATHGIEEIRIFNRLDSPGIAARASRLAIEIGLEQNHLVEVWRREIDEPFGGIDGNPLIFKPTIPIPGRFVRIRLLTRNYLHLDQVEVYGDPLPKLESAAG